MTFKVNFCILGQHVLTKIFVWQKSPNFILQDPSFEFFISYVVPEIFLFFGSDTCIPDLKRTTFKYKPFAFFIHTSAHFHVSLEPKQVGAFQHPFFYGSRGLSKFGELSNFWGLLGKGTVKVKMGTIIKETCSPHFKRHNILYLRKG